MMLSKRKNQNLLILLLLSLFLFLLWATPASAQLRGGDLLEKSVEAAELSEAAMDDMWEALFVNNTLLYNQLVETATIINIVAFPFVMMSFGHAVRDQNSAKAAEIIAWVFVVYILLYNGGAMLKQTTMGIREIINKEAIALLEVQVDDLTIRDAMRDVILTEQLRDRISDIYTECEAKEGSAQLECISEASEYAEKMVTEYEEKAWGGPGLQRLIGNLRDLRIAQNEKLEKATAESASPERISEIILDENGSEFYSLLFSSATSSANKAILKSYQNWFTYGFEFALMLTGMLGPFAIAASLIPKSPRAIFSWLIGLISIGILKLSYNLVVGFAALYASKAGVIEAGSAGFLMMISIGAPFIAVAIAGGGGAAIFFSLGKTTAAVATIIPVGGSMASSAASSLPRRS